MKLFDQGDARLIAKIGLVALSGYALLISSACAVGTAIHVFRIAAGL